MAWSTTADWKSGLDSVGMTDYFRDQQIPDSVAGILSDGNWEVIFHQFTQSEFSSENLDFLRSVAVFESSGDLNQAAEIYKGYVSTSAPRQVNLPESTRRDLDEIFGEGKDGIGPPSLFDQAKREITNLLGRDTFRRFRTEGQAQQEKLAAEIDWDNVEGRERAEAQPGSPAEPAAAAPSKPRLFPKKQ
jgi:hypothetical protein